jgi:hypothetical protein
VKRVGLFLVYLSISAETDDAMLGQEDSEGRPGRLVYSADLVLKEAKDYHGADCQSYQRRG